MKGYMQQDDRAVNQQKVEAPLENTDIHETAKPPDAETLLTGLERTHAFAQEYAHSSLGQTRAEAQDFLGHTTPTRQKLIDDNLDRLRGDHDVEEEDAEFGIKLNRTDVIVHTAELIIEQAAADMADAKKQIHQAARLLVNIESITKNPEGKIDKLKEAQVLLQNLDASTITLSVYLEGVRDDVKGLAQFCERNGLSTRYTAFMREILEEYRIQSGSVFDSDQQTAQLEPTFAREAQTLTNQNMFRDALTIIEEQIQAEQGKQSITAPTLVEESAEDQQPAEPRIDQQTESPQSRATEQTGAPSDGQSGQQPHGENILDFVRDHQKKNQQAA